MAPLISNHEHSYFHIVIRSGEEGLGCGTQGGRVGPLLLSTPQREDEMERRASCQCVIFGGLVIGPVVVADRLWSALLSRPL